MPLRRFDLRIQVVELLGRGSIVFQEIFDAPFFAVEGRQLLFDGSRLALVHGELGFDGGAFGGNGFDRCLQLFAFQGKLHRIDAAGFCACFQYLPFLDVQGQDFSRGFSAHNAFFGFKVAISIGFGRVFLAGRKAGEEQGDRKV